MFDSMLVIPEGSEPAKLEKLLEIAPVSESDIKAAVKIWKTRNPGEFENILTADPE